MRKLRNTLVGAVAMALLAIFTPAPAFAYGSIPVGARLLHPLPSDPSYVDTGSGVRDIVNSSGQKIGEYQIFVDYRLVSGKYRVYVDIEVRDTWLGNGRGVKIKLMTKTGAGTSNVIGTYKGANAPSWNRWSDETVATTDPMWAFDVDHGEDWAGVPFRFTGTFDRFVNQSETTRDNYPFFNLYG